MNKAHPSGDRHSYVTLRISGMGSEVKRFRLLGRGRRDGSGVAVSSDFRLGSHKAIPLRSSLEAQ